MYVTVHNAIHYVLERGFVSGHSVIHDNCRVTSVSSRNRSFKVSFGSNAGVFLKQARPTDAVMGLGLEIEAECGRSFQKPENRTLLGDHVPAVLGYDRQRGILCSELIRNDQSLRSFQMNRRELRPAVAELLGNTLAKFHSATAMRIAKSLPKAAEHRVPFLLQSNALASGALQDPAGVYGRIQAYPEYVNLIRRSASLWQANGLMHGDIRWDNFLVEERAVGLHLRVIDWELSGYGDTAWDVGGVLQAYLIDWIANVIDLDEMQDVVFRFWSAYSKRLALPQSDLSNLLRRSVVFAGCRLIQSTFEQHQFGNPLTDLGLQMLQLSWNILQDPAAIERELLSLARPHTQIQSINRGTV